MDARADQFAAYPPIDALLSSKIPALDQVLVSAFGDLATPLNVGQALAEGVSPDAGLALISLPDTPLIPDTSIDTAQTLSAGSVSPSYDQPTDQSPAQARAAIAQDAPPRRGGSHDEAPAYAAYDQPAYQNPQQARAYARAGGGQYDAPAYAPASSAGPARFAQAANLDAPAYATFAALSHSTIASDAGEASAPPPLATTPAMLGELDRVYGDVTSTRTQLISRRPAT
jgi:hypothetical protein